uniref:Hyp17 n=1 Tax=Moniliophthora roreri (strain MCA 2997) TaxID=1381753 RepID=F2WVK8_MONRO|nr:hyp17 [Moniliophthora roreri]ADO51600.1 hyp17 [Moniliophthora roreri]
MLLFILYFIMCILAYEVTALAKATLDLTLNLFEVLFFRFMFKVLFKSFNISTFILFTNKSALILSFISIILLIILVLK